MSQPSPETMTESPRNAATGEIRTLQPPWSGDAGQTAIVEPLPSETRTLGNQIPKGNGGTSETRKGGEGIGIGIGRHRVTGGGTLEIEMFETEMFETEMFEIEREMCNQGRLLLQRGIGGLLAV